MSVDKFQTLSTCEKHGSLELSDNEGGKPMYEEAGNVTATQVQDLVGQVPGVASCRVVTNDWGAIEELHVIGTLERHPKQISRDIQSALQAGLGLAIDHRKISIAQLHGLDPTLPPPRLRLLNVDVISDLTQGQMRVRVVLGHETDPDGVFTGEVQGGYGRLQILRLSAEATLLAVNQVVAAGRAFAFEDVSQVKLHGAEAIVVTISLLTQPRLGELLAGVALVKHDVPDAVVRATLDAVNRPLGRLHRLQGETGPHPAADASGAADAADAAVPEVAAAGAVDEAEM